MWRNKWAGSKPSTSGKIKFEVQRDESEGLVVKVDARPQHKFGLVRQSVLAAVGEPVATTNRSVTVRFAEYRALVNALLPACAAEKLELVKIPVPIETWLASQLDAAQSDSTPMDWDRIPSKIRSAIFPYQRAGIERAIRRGGKLFFADEMGLGKSLQSIAVLAYYSETSTTKQLIVCPSYLRLNWQRELGMWTDLAPASIQVIFKTKVPIDVEAHDTVIISYDLAVRKIAEIQRIQWCTIVCDESHYLKTRNAKRTKMLTPVLRRAKHLMLLSGTPALSRPSELYSQLHTLYPRVFSKWSPFAFRYCDMKKTVFGWDSSGASNLDELNIVLRNVMVRRLKKDVLSQLPSKMRETLEITLKKKELTEMQPLFDQLATLNTELRAVRSATDADRLKVFERQALVSELFRKTCAAKIPAVSEYVLNLAERSDNHQHILFAHHHSMLDALEAVCIESTALPSIGGTDDSRDGE